MDSIFVVWYIRNYGDGLKKTTVHCSTQHEAVILFSKVYPDTLIRLVEPVRKNREQEKDYKQPQRRTK